MKFLAFNMAAKIPCKVFGKRQSGFTLMEIIMVVFLIGLTATFAVANLGDTEGQKARHEAERFAALANHVLDEAVLLGKPIGIEVNDGDGSYQFKIYDGGWRKPDKADSFMHKRELPENISMRFILLESNRPVSVNNQQKSSFTPSRVHEVLNDSILDLEEGESVEKDLYANSQMIVAEPTGLLPPFTLEISTKDRNFTVQLNDFGKAMVDDPNAEK